MAALDHADCCAHPGCNALLHIDVAPVSHDYLALDSHTCHDMTVLTVSVCRLVLVHEIHVDGVVRNLLIKLGM